MFDFNQTKLSLSLFFDLHNLTTHQQHLPFNIIDKWNYKLEFILIVLIGIFSLPANLFLIVFYNEKARKYKQRRQQNPNKARIANSFYTYLRILASFDTILVIYLILDTTLMLLSKLGKTEYESVYDLSSFACKFFIYVVRISSGMSNCLTCFLSINQCLILKGNYRICFNTKYLSLFVFCICIISNVFRLERLRLNPNSQLETVTSSHGKSLLEIYLDELQETKKSLCFPNINLTKKATDKVFWLIFIYNLMFTQAPIILNMMLSFYMIRRQSEFKKNLAKLIVIFQKIEKKCKNIQKRSHSLVKRNFIRMDITISQIRCDSLHTTYINLDKVQNYDWIERFFERAGQTSKLANPQKLKLNVFHLEFMRTCSACISLSVAQVILNLPYAMIELTNQFLPSLHLINSLQYMTYTRYLFYGIKFYLLFLVSALFRKEFRAFFRKSSIRRRNKLLKLHHDTLNQRPQQREFSL